MKKQQRAFVVETKSTRRRLKMESRSIWGDTHFRTLVREAEAENPVKNSVLSDVSGDDEALPSHLAQLAAPAVLIDNSDQKRDDPLATAADKSLRGLQDKALMNGDAAAAVVEKSTRRAPKRRKANPGSIIVTASDMSAIIKGDTVSDELALLDEENRRLKLLLAKGLRQQNTQLRKMYERFEVVR
jgi:hypothetical protein